MSGSRGLDHYAVLGLPSGEEGSKLSLEEIRKAFNQSLIRHPDKRPDDPIDAKLRAQRKQVLRDSFQDSKRQKMATALEERERSAAVAVDPAEEVRLKEKRKADELKKEIAEFQARRAKKASESVYGQPNKENKVGGEKAGQCCPGIDIVVGADFEIFEALVMKKLQETANKKKKRDNEKKKCMK